MNFKTFNKAFLGACTETAEKLHEVAVVNKSQFEQSGGQDDKAKTVYQRAECHELKAKQLAEISEGALKVIHELNRNPADILAQSRELKKRLIAGVEAIAANTRVKGDNPLDAVLTYIAAKNVTELSYSVINKEAGQKTSTQAGYMRRFFKFFGAVVSEDTSAPKNPKFTLDPEHALVKRLVALYTVAPSAPASETVPSS